MGILKKSKKDKTPASKEGSEEETPALTNEEEHPQASTTELNLHESHQQARSAFRRAQKAEQEYRIRKQATAARTDKEAAFQHFRNSFKEFTKGCRAGMRWLKLLPAIAREKKAKWGQKREVKRLEREEERRKRLSAEIKKVEEKKKKKMGEGVGEGAAVESTTAE